MFDIGGPEFIALLVLALLVFGPRRLPQIGRQLGGFANQMRRAVNDFKGTLEREVALEEVRTAAREAVAQARGEAESLTNELKGVGPPAYADPTRARRDVTPPEPPAG
ncbi:MAG: twin-arginine translocase subunit TatB [Acidobacteria bacterium]|nr:twin-arginine translocase subunit TatB [Acidobacteriota bacterium]